VSAPHLARSYHHLFPLDAFQEVPLEEYQGERYASCICDNECTSRPCIFFVTKVRIAGSSFFTAGDTVECSGGFGHLWQSEIFVVPVNIYAVCLVE